MLFGLVTKAELREATRALEERLEKLEKKCELLEYDWQSWYDKYRSLYARLMKREKTAAPEPEEDPPAPAPIPWKSRRGF